MIMLYSNIRKLLKKISLESGFYISGTTELSKLKEFFSKINPIATGCGLTRIGDMADGGYLVPNDLQGISACFSPGVSKEASFELAFANKGIQCYLADYSVNGPPFENQHFDFEKKYLGPENNQVFMTLERWVNEKQPTGAEFILQMDIEGAEYGVILETPLETLKKFRILVIEFHGLNRLFSPGGIDIIDLAFQKLLKYYEIVHIHPNNCAEPMKLHGFTVPPVMEFTFLRKDRISDFQPEQNFPHSLDFKNVPNLPDVVLPMCWANGGQILK